MLVTLNKPCHVRHASRITTSQKIFTELCYCVSKEWAKSWSRASLVTNFKTFFKKLSTDRPKTQKKRRKKEKRKNGNSKGFCVKRKRKKLLQQFSLLFLTMIKQKYLTKKQFTFRTFFKVLIGKIFSHFQCNVCANAKGV